MGSEISRPAYSLAEAADVAAAANLIASEARAAGCTVVRPFNGAQLEGRPTWTAAHSVMWWHVDMEYARDAAHNAERDALRARAEAAEQRAEALAAELAQARADQAEARGFLAECHKQLDELEGILSDTLAARARAEAEAERLRSAIAETLRLADIYAGVAAHNAEAEPETAGEAWRSAGAATVRELRRVLGGAA